MRAAIRVLFVGLVGVALSSRCADDGGPSHPEPPFCDAAALTAALAAAVPGDIVSMGACTLTGSFTVPAGVTLRGQGRDASILVSAGDPPVVRVAPGATPGRLEDVRVRSSGHTGVLLLKGPGAVEVTGVTVEATRGMALAGEEIDSVVLTDVELIGPVTPENVRTIPPLATASDTATHGLILIRVPAVRLTDVTATGFARFGALLVSCRTVWTRGGAVGNRGTGLMVYAGSAVIHSLDLSGSLGDSTLIPAYGGVFTAGAAIDTTDLVASGGANFGLVHDNATARHVGLTANDNREAGVWVQSCPSFELHRAELLRNGLAGLLLVDTGDTLLENVRADETRLLPTVFGETGRVDVGAGIEIIRPRGTVTVVGSELHSNEQVGLLVQLDASATMGGISFADVAVSGSGLQYGAVAQGGLVVAGWDAGIARDAVTSANDTARTAALDRAGSLDAGDMPAVDAVVDLGLIGLIDPDPPF